MCAGLRSEINHDPGWSCIYHAKSLYSLWAVPFELPQSAKRVPSELSKVKKLIESGAPVIASLSSSYMGVLPYKKRGQVKSALKKLGFTNVCDAAEGAALATEEYVRLLEQGEMKNIITTACPSIVNLIEIHYPELIKYLHRC